MHTVAELIAQASQQLNNNANAKLDCEVLLAELLQRDRSFIYSHPEFQPTANIVADYQRMIATRQQGLPVAYITGKKEFLSLPFKVNQATLIPRPETELLVETAIANISVDSHDSLLDLCTGSGIIAISIAKFRSQLKIIASDISEQALSVAADNIHNLQVNNVNTVQSDLFNKLADKQFHYIISNPPYIRSDDHCLDNTDIRHEPRLALDGGEEGLDYLLRIIKHSQNHLYNGGLLMLEHGHTQAESVREYMQQNSYTDIQTITDYAGHERITMGKKHG